MLRLMQFSDIVSKTCSICGADKPLDAYHIHPHGRLGRQSRCKSCQATLEQARYTSLTEEERQRRVAAVKARKYGFASPEEMERFAADHGDLCDVCGEPDTTHRKATWTQGLTFDHDHVTGARRGMLCSSCNLGLGNFGDDPERLRAAADYIERHRR